MGPRRPQEETSKHQLCKNIAFEKSMKQIKQHSKTQVAAMRIQKRKSKTQVAAMMSTLKLSRSPGRLKTQGAGELIPT